MQRFNHVNNEHVHTSLQFETNFREKKRVLNIFGDLEDEIIDMRWIKSWQRCLWNFSSTPQLASVSLS